MIASRHLIASTGAAITSIIFVVLITIAAEVSPALKTILKNMTGHHWVSKSVLDIIVFAIAYPMVYATHRDASDGSVAIHLWVLIACVIVGTLLITGFFVRHYLAA